MGVGNLRNGVRSHFMPRSVQILNLIVIGPFVADVERGRDRTAVGILVLALVKQLLIERPDGVVDGVVERQQDDLRHAGPLQTACETRFRK